MALARSGAASTDSSRPARVLGSEEAIVQAALARGATMRSGATVAPGYQEKISAKTAANSSSRNSSRLRSPSGPVHVLTRTVSRPDEGTIE
jgi:hypothetical protein